MSNDSSDGPTPVQLADGDHVPRVAALAGFLDAKVVWDDPANAELRQSRTDPCIMLVGDSVTIPAKNASAQPCATNQRNTFAYKGKPLRLRVVLQGANRKPLAGQSVTLAVDEVTGNDPAAKATTDGSGMVDRPVPRTAAKGRLRFHIDDPDLDVDAPVMIGGMPPISTWQGIVARLDNLGYTVGARGDLLGGDVSGHGGTDVNAGVDGDDDFARRYRSAVEEFQCDEHLSVDGIPGPQTQAALVKAHGC
jgi:hypothetical protein